MTHEHRPANLPDDLVCAAGIQLLRNRAALEPKAPYEALPDVALNAAGFEQAMAEISRWPAYRPTPLTVLPGLANELGLGALWYKDERLRFELKSFKALGGAYAVSKVLRARLAELPQASPSEASLDDLFSGRYADAAATVTVTCATDGNHGRSVAWGARLLGCRCVIFVHETVSAGRVSAIEQFGAQVIRVPGNYDDAVRHAAEQAEQNQWTVVSDTSYEGYRDIPIDVMHGYGVMAHEIAAQVETSPTHVFLQTGVGAMAAAITAAFWLQWGEHRPKVIVVEPVDAACHLASVIAGHTVAITGELDTIMAGLACGEVSELAWPILHGGGNVFMTITDDHARCAMRLFAKPPGQDRPIVSGETGACGLGALLAATAEPAIMQALELDQNSRVLLIGSEGDTDASIYESIVGCSAEAVLA